MFFRQLLLLIHKNLLILRRTKLRTAAEIIVGLIISLPVILIVINIAVTNKVAEEEFDSFKVTGNWKDLNRRLRFLQTINKIYCMSNKSLGITFRQNVSTDEIERLMNAIEERYNNAASGAFNISVKLFDSEIHLNNILTNDFDPEKMCGKYMGGIVFKEYDLSTKRLSYVIRLREGRDMLQKWYTGDALWVKNGPYAILSDYSLVPGSPNYWSSGFISLQYAIDSIFIQAIRNWPNEEDDDDSTFRLQLQRMPEPAYYAKTIMEFLIYLAYMWPLVVSLIIGSTVSIVASEKESAVKAYLTVMGLRSSVFYASHSVIAFIKLAIIILPSAIIIAPHFITVSASLFLVATVIYCAAVIVFAMLMTSLFHSSSSAVKGSLIIWFCSCGLVYFMPIPHHMLLYLLASLNINFTLYNAMLAIRDYMNRDMELSWLNCFEFGSTEAFPFGTALLMMCFDIAWMWLLTIYLDNVYPPNEIPRKHPLYFLPTSIFDPEAGNVKSMSDDDDDELDAGNENIETDTDHVDADENAADVDVRHLKKFFGSVRAVDDLSFCAYPGKVTVLLGHNGAGKSTTFSILTGITSPSAGSIRICGVPLNPSTLDLCQRNIGFCPQYNPLFDRLTVREHLQLIRRLRSSKSDCSQQLIDELQLSDKADELAMNLSGGMKRKLCVAMSLVGGSRLVLLDEPTAGMDPGARHIVGELLERYKNGRTVLLTTHYMDEADLLGDRISIMVNGRLACAGTSDFLKARFGTGYLLEIALKDHPFISNRLEGLMKIIRTFVENAQIQSTTAQQITVLLPVEHKPMLVYYYYY